MLGVIGFAGQIPSLVITPLAGVYADRINRRNVLIAVQSVAMVMAFLMAWLTLTGRVEVWHLIVIASINGIALGFDTPFRHSFLLDLVGDKALLQNAIALNSTLINSARFVGPMLGGFLIAIIGEGFCFLINGVSFWAVIIALIAINVSVKPVTTAKKSIFTDLSEGLKYSYKTIQIRYLLLLVFASSLFGLPFQVFLPYFASDVLNGSSQLLGILTGFFGAGALVGAISLTYKSSTNGIIKNIIVAAFIFSLGLMVFSLSNNAILSFAALPFVGYGMIILFASTNTYLQTFAESDKRGRVISLYGMSFMGITPIGSLLLGSISSTITVPITIFMSSLICLAFAIFILRKRKVICKDLRTL